MRWAVLGCAEGREALLARLRKHMLAACFVLETESRWLYDNQVVAMVADVERFEFRFERIHPARIASEARDKRVCGCLGWSIISLLSLHLGREWLGENKDSDTSEQVRARYRQKNVLWESASPKVQYFLRYLSADVAASTFRAVRFESASWFILLIGMSVIMPRCVPYSLNRDEEYTQAVSTAAAVIVLVGVLLAFQLLLVPMMTVVFQREV